MNISYQILITIINLITEDTETFDKNFLFELEDLPDYLLYNNHHLIATKIQMFSLFKNEINNYCENHSITINQIEIEEFNIISNTDRVDVYFESDENDDQISLEPNIKCYVYPKYDELDTPVLNGTAYDDHSIIWSWEDDGMAHYLTTEAIDITNEEDTDKIIAQLPIGTNQYVETNLEPDTQYTRRLISYDSERTSPVSRATTIQTLTASIDQSLEQYEIEKNYDYTTNPEEREIIEERLEAFHSGIGDYNDLKVYKQMDDGFYQTFKTYIQLRGMRKQREKRYDSVGFNYKVCLEAEETVEEQKGEVTFDIEVYPIENITIRDYMYAVQPVEVGVQLKCDVLLKRQETESNTVSATIMEPSWTHNDEFIEFKKDTSFNYTLDNLHVVFFVDLTWSMVDQYSGNKIHIYYLNENDPDNYNKYELTNSEGKNRSNLYVKLGKGTESKNYPIVDGKKGIYEGRKTDALPAFISSMNTVINRMQDIQQKVKNQTGIQPTIKFSLITFTNKDDVKIKANKVGFKAIKDAIDPKKLYHDSSKKSSETNWAAAYKKAVSEKIIDGKYNVLSMFYTDGVPTQDSDPTTIEKAYNKFKNATINNNKKLFNLGVMINGVKGFIYKPKSDDKQVINTNKVASYLAAAGFIKSSTVTNKKAQEGFMTGNKEWRGLGPWTNENDLVKISEKLEEVLFTKIEKNTYTDPITKQVFQSLDAVNTFIDTQIAAGSTLYAKNPPRVKIDKGYTFNGWSQTNNVVSIPVVGDIDVYKWEPITISFTFKIGGQDDTNVNAITPVVYARNELRAIIPSDSIIKDLNFDPQNGPYENPAVKANATDIKTLISNAVSSTSSYISGFNQVVTDSNNNYIIKNLIINDTYRYSDEDSITDANFNDNNDRMTDGYAGSLNVYAEINKMNTTSYKDDIYTVANDKYIWVSGYTDAIIFDGQRDLSFDLNCSGITQNDFDRRVIIDPNANYTTVLTNRKNKSITYNPSNPSSGKVYHVIDIIKKDKDIYIDTSDYLKEEGDWSLIVPTGTQISDLSTIMRGYVYPNVETMNRIEAKIDLKYQSPILNYRFNYEDPDAYTNYYELLPDADQNMPYKNIVLVHIYYADNIYIQDRRNNNGQLYIEHFGNNDNVTKVSEFYQNSTLTLGVNYFRDDYIDHTIWFKAKEMYETRTYYDEKPNAGMDSLYGNVNGRYFSDSPNGKKDLRVATPQFNLPTTVNANDIHIYIMITEFSPNDALVSYKWDHPLNESNSITKINGDYVTFSSDTLTYKDEEYNDLIQTITSPSMELTNNKTITKDFKISKPETKYAYEKYFIEMFSDNGDVMILNYPKEVVFDENGNSEIGAEIKGVVNATTKWSPRIHNGYYYLNQHEYFAYSKFDVEADFEEYNEDNYETINGYLTINVELIHQAGDPESYDISKSTRSELMQNEEDFIWNIDRGLTLKPIIDGMYYKQYEQSSYITPVIMFPHTLTATGKLKIDYFYEDTYNKQDITDLDDIDMYVRSYDIDNGKWSEWSEFTNNSIPNCPKSCAYQAKLELNASVINEDIILEDYLCCYLDWKDDGDIENCTNCTIITDHIKASPFETDGIFVSKILDYGCDAILKMDIFESQKLNNCSIFVATSDNKDDLELENVAWEQRYEQVIDIETKRYFRYKIVIPYNEKLYWLHKIVKTKKSYPTIPYITKISMSGSYIPVDVYDSFQEVKVFEINTDGAQHRIFSSLYNIISEDILNKGFTSEEIHLVSLSSTNHNITLKYNEFIETENPTVSILNTPIYATADFSVKTSTKHSPYIYATLDPVKEKDIIHITKGTPQQYCPITVEDYDGNNYKEVFDCDPETLKKTENIVIESEDDRHYVLISRNDYDIDTIEVQLNDEPFSLYNIMNNIIIFDDLLNINDKLKITYNIQNSFYTEIDYENDKTDITIYSNYHNEIAKREELLNIRPLSENTDYTECNLDQIFGNGFKKTLLNKVFYSDNHWRYDANDNSVYYSRYYNGFAMLVNDLLPMSTYELTIRSYSTDYNGNVIGIIAGYIKDQTNVIHTLSYLVSLNNKFDNKKIALILDYGTDTERIIATKSISCQFTKWSDMSNGIMFYTKKQNNNITCKISVWNDPNTWNNESEISYNVSNSEDTVIFNQATSYGFCTQSQKNVYFTDPTFIGRIDRNVTVEEQISKLRHRYKVYFETNKTNNKFVANDLSLNPIYRTDYKGFIYLTDEHNEPYKINIYRNPKYIKCGGYDKIDVTIECLDYEGNPVISKEIDIDCQSGILIFDNTDSKQKTDINGVIHLVYESAVNRCIDTLTARTTTSDNKVIGCSVEIINE